MQEQPAVEEFEEDRRPHERVKLANAPVSYGAFEITVGKNPHVPDAGQLLRAVSAAGYAGIDLGPLGYLGDAGNLSTHLREHELELAGAYIQLPFSEPEKLEAHWGGLVELLGVLDTLDPQEISAKPTLADAGSPARQKRPGLAASDREAGLTQQGWGRFLEGLERVVSACGERGFEPTFHPHAGTYVEAGWEVERLLESSDVGICFDPGHLLIGGTDPAAALASWASRVNHFHVKDARIPVMRRLAEEAAQLDAYYSGEVFCRLGEGDAAVEAIASHIRESDFEGWVVVEQDFIPHSRSTMQRAIADQQANMQFLRERGL